MPRPKTTPNMARAGDIKKAPWTVVTCAMCGEKTIYWKQLLTLEGWACDRVTQKWMCPQCLEREARQR